MIFNKGVKLVGKAIGITLVQKVRYKNKILYLKIKLKI